MSNFTIGRVGLDVDVNNIVAWEDSGDMLRVTALTTGTVAQALRIRQQLAGYVNSADEPFVPVTWSDRPSVNGIYRVRDASVDNGTGAAASGIFAIDMTLEPVQGASAPAFEAISLGAVRTNAFGFVAATAKPWFGVPYDSRGYDPGVSVTPTFAGRAGADGTVLVYCDGGNYLYDAKSSFFLAPTAWYKNAATLKVKGDIVTGRQVQNAPADWEISNGLVRLQGGPGRWVISWWNGAAWTGNLNYVYPMVYIPGGNPTTFAGDPHTITVLRNGPEAVGIRLTYDSDSVITGTVFPVVVDIMLRRGSYMFSASITTRAAALRWGLAMYPNGTNTTAALTAGFRMMNAGLAGAAFVLAASSAWTSYNTFVAQDSLYSTAPTTLFKFAFGVCPGYAAAVAPNRAQDLIDQWMAATTVEIAAVAR